MSIDDNVSLSRRMGRAWATEPIAEDLTDDQREQMQRTAVDMESGFDDLPDWAQAAIIAGEASQTAS
jgi:hypothetical protein